MRIAIARWKMRRRVVTARVEETKSILGQIWCNTAYIGNIYRLRYDLGLPYIGMI